MNHPTHNPATATGRFDSGPGAADKARARLAAAFALPLGPVREQRITSAVLELIAAEIGDRYPGIVTVLFDWEPYGGLGVAGFRDGHDNPVTDHDLALDITHYATDIRAITGTALTGSRPHELGLFRLDLTATVSDDRRTDQPIPATPSVGDRVRITGRMPGDPDPLEIGTTGTVTRLSTPRLGQIYVDWDNGRSLILLASDPFEILPADTP